MKDPEGRKRRRRVGARIGEWANVIVAHFTNPDKGWRRETDQFAIS